MKHYSLASVSTALGKAQRDAIRNEALADSSDPFAGARLAKDLARDNGWYVDEGLPWAADLRQSELARDRSGKLVAPAEASPLRPIPDPKRLTVFKREASTPQAEATEIANAANRRVNERRAMIERDYLASAKRLGFVPHAY